MRVPGLDLDALGQTTRSPAGQGRARREPAHPGIDGGSHTAGRAAGADQQQARGVGQRQRLGKAWCLFLAVQNAAAFPHSASVTPMRSGVLRL